MIRLHSGQGGGAGRSAVSCCVLAVIALLCVTGLCTPAAAHADTGEHRLLADVEPPPDMDEKDPPSRCHGAPGTPADPVPPPPVPLHVPDTDPAPRATFARAAPGPGGPAHDGVPSVDLHRLQIQRT
ncbi:hypothetical protein [Streptomyces marincola]|uniref:hypothetical protein n=1 Tax=Streptomyces marincola TaxID=2878388 RepID=UPI001CF462B9|nr:hypothetical protein [Streptomyces marincola]UCM86981.1 hypothetical protein LC193_02965 [Streptomyces marincola]